MKFHCHKLSLLAISVLLAACVKDKPGMPGGNPPATAGRSLLIANEGSLGNGNASLSVYNIDADSIYNDVFFQKNSSRLGDVFQSIFEDDGTLYLAINNSDKLVVVDKEDYSFIRNITVTKPRYIVKAGDSKLYVSSLFYPQINIVNTENGAVQGNITLDFPNTEGMLMANGKVYACNWDTACNYLYEIDPGTDAITQRIPLAGYAPQQVLEDKNGDLWVLAGNVYKNKGATLSQIDPVSRSIKKSFIFPEGADVMKPTWNPTRDTLYYLGVNYDGATDYNGVYRMSINAVSLPETLFVQAATFQYFWSLGVDPVTNHVYVGDPKGFIQKGSVSVYDASGNFLRTFPTGIGPGFFYFQ